MALALEVNELGGCELGACAGRGGSLPMALALEVNELGGCELGARAGRGGNFPMALALEVNEFGTCAGKGVPLWDDFELAG